jgi:peptidoglycan/LPS O-acetylase OafA/YrhL
MFSHKDLISTILVVIVGALVYLDSTGIMFPFSSHYRAGTIMLFVLGLSICAFGSKAAWPIKKSNLWLSLSAALGILALAVGIVGIVVGSKFFFYLLAAIITLLWGITTLRHLVS